MARLVRLANQAPGCNGSSVFTRGAWHASPLPIAVSTPTTESRRPGRATALVYEPLGDGGRTSETINAHACATTRSVHPATTNCSLRALVLTPASSYEGWCRREFPPREIIHRGVCGRGGPGLLPRCLTLYKRLARYSGHARVLDSLHSYACLTSCSRRGRPEQQGLL